MEDSRIRKLARLVIRYCINPKKNSSVLISGSSESEDFVDELYKQAILAKANPLIHMYPKNTNFFFFKHANKQQLKYFPDYWFKAIKKASAYISIDTEFNPKELSSINPKKISIRQKTVAPISQYLSNRRDKIVTSLVAYPCLAHAIEANMSLDEWKDFVFNACFLDWKTLTKKAEKINKVFEKGKEVYLIGNNVDLGFSIHKKNSVIDVGRENMPGGEIFMSPNRTSLNGWIKFEGSSFYNGKEISDIFLRFKNGKVVEFDASKNKNALKSALESDTNSSYVGEFGIGLNPNITKVTHNTLFDEKITGTIHLALGEAYIENGGGNDSIIHWDLIKDMRKAKIILDGKVIQEKGKWKI